MKQKRWILMEVPKDVNGWSVKFSIDSRTLQLEYPKLIKGPVELVQAAHKEAGVRYAMPKKGDWVLDGMGWGQHSGLVNESREWPVIPAELEPCANCQNVKGFGHVLASPKARHDYPWRCKFCNRPESEWTYAKDTDWAGIGSGIM